MFELLSWSYRFVYLALIAFFSLSCYLVYYGKMDLFRVFLPIINILTAASSFLLLAYYYEPIDYTTIYVGCGLIALYIFARLFAVKLLKLNDLLLFDAVSFLLTIGLCVLYRLSPEYGLKQLAFALIGYAVFFIVFSIMKKIEVLSDYALYFGIVLLSALVLTQLFGIQISGSRNWIRIGILNFQPSEFLKIVYVYFLACLLFNPLTIKRFLATFLSVITIILFFALQRDFGSAFIFFAIYLIMLTVCDDSYYYASISFSAAILGAVLSYFSFSYIQARVLAWINPWKYVSGKSYQITQSLFAVATGGLLGRGLYMGDPKFIPAIHTDFIFSAICEEIGILGAISILSIYILITIIGMDISFKCKNKINRLAAIGLTSLTAIQTLIIVCGVLNLIPITGVTLPFISYGGSSLISQFINFSLLYFIIEKEKGEKDAEQI